MPYDKVTPDTILAATKKLLDAYNSEAKKSNTKGESDE